MVGRRKTRAIGDCPQLASCDGGEDHGPATSPKHDANDLKRSQAGDSSGSRSPSVPFALCVRVSSPTYVFDILGSDRIVVSVAEVRAHIVHHGGDLVVA